MSKITVAGVREHVAELLEYSLETKKRNFLETVEYVAHKVSSVSSHPANLYRLFVDSRSASRTMIPSVPEKRLSRWGS